MDPRQVEESRARLGGRTKRDLILGMVARSPHKIATEKMVLALEGYPLLLLLLAHDHPTRIWILDRGEKPSSAAILNDAVRGKRWHDEGIGLDSCEGLTDVVDGYVAVVVSWKTLLLMRHEFAHAVTTFLSPDSRARLEQLFREATDRRQFTEPLASRSIGEYVACGLSYCLFPELKEELRRVDPALFELVTRMLDEAEAVSERLLEPVAVAAIHL